MNEIENPMVVDSKWRELEKHPQVIDECPGCFEDIVVGEDVYEFHDFGETILIHQDAECCRNFIAELSICKIAEKK